jgi:hypothetical protein
VCPSPLLTLPCAPISPTDPAMRAQVGEAALEVAACPSPARPPLPPLTPPSPLPPPWSAHARTHAMECPIPLCARLCSLTSLTSLATRLYRSNRISPQVGEAASEAADFASKPENTLPLLAGAGVAAYAALNYHSTLEAGTEITRGGCWDGGL